jgi:hypothetical protein
MAVAGMSDEVRIATREDRQEIIRLLHLMHAEGGLFPLDLDAANSMFDRAFDRKGAIIGVIGPRNDIRGIIILLITQFWYTKEPHLEELANFIRPDARHSNLARTLIAFAKRCADAISIPLVIGVMTNRRVVEKVRLYRRSLGNPAGAFFVYPADKWVSDIIENDDFWKAPFPARGAKLTQVK